MVTDLPLILAVTVLRPTKRMIVPLTLTTLVTMPTLKYHYGSNHTCTYQTKSDSTSQSGAYNSVDSYDIGDKKKLLKMKGGSTYSDLGTGMVTWGVGVAFLSLGGLILIVWIGMALFMFCQVTMLSQNLAAFDKQREQKTEFSPWLRRYYVMLF